MRVVPGLSVWAPADARETEAALRLVARQPGPAFVSLAQDEAFEINEAPDLAAGEARLCRAGDDIALLSAGPVLGEALAAAKRLEEAGLQARVLSFPCIKPLDSAAVLRAATKRRAS